MKKEELAKAIFEERNRLHRLNGQTTRDLEDPNAIGMIRDYAGRHKASELENELRGITSKIAQTEHAARVEAYYDTSEGAALKAEITAAVEQKRNEWQEHDKHTIQTIDDLLKPALGEHWGVCRLSDGCVEVGVIDAEKSAPGRRECYSGQTLEIRYEEQHWLDKAERFEAGCGGTAGIRMEGHCAVGEKAMFYIGFGRLLGDTKLVGSLKALLKESARTTNRMSAELKALNDRLANPLPDLEK